MVKTRGFPLKMWFSLAVAALVISGGSTYAQTAGPTLAKCTCHFDEKDPPTVDGAQAVNATLCIQMLDKGHKWCEITVACLRGNMGPQCGAGAAPKEALLPLYAYAVAQISQSNDPGSTSIVAGFGAQEGQFQQLIAVNGDAIADCANAYTRRGDDQQIPGKQFHCAFDRQSGWLACSFDLGSQSVQFSFGRRE